MTTTVTLANDRAPGPITVEEALALLQDEQGKHAAAKLGKAVLILEPLDLVRLLRLLGGRQGETLDEDALRVRLIFEGNKLLTWTGQGHLLGKRKGGIA